jgi:UDP-N-acetylglucosamine transferase subunit ALG13
MIFVTTGTQFPFDRLLSFIEEWSNNNTNIRIVAQTGNTEFKSKNMELHSYLEPQIYAHYLKNALILVGHLGTGTMIDAQKHGIPAILMPRKFELNEHRSEHQISTAKQFKDKKGIYIVDDKLTLFSLLDDMKALVPPEMASNGNKEQLVSFLKMKVLENQ